MTDSSTPSDIEQLPQAWRNLWRVHTVLPDSVASDELTIFVRAGGRDAAHLAVKRALHAMFPAAYQGGSANCSTKPRPRRPASRSASPRQVASPQRLPADVGQRQLFVRVNNGASPA